ncbi:MAG: DUF4253 domain-containing protein [Candidatus Lernaella stagnicola]|nr:DUF4253 domain-containing protein [Candidatus Lernaella stagnicola]
MTPYATNYAWTAFLVAVAIALLWIAFRLVRKDREADDFATPLPRIDDVTELLGLATALTPRPYFTHHHGEQKDESGISAVVPWRTAKQRLARLRVALPAGYVAYLTDPVFSRNYQSYETVELVIAPGRDPFDIARRGRTDAVNHELATEDIIARLRAIDEQFGIDPYLADADTVGFVLRRVPEDLPAFAQRLYDFCPDIVDQGAGSLEALAAGIGRTRDVILWWA